MKKSIGNLIKEKLDGSPYNVTEFSNLINKERSTVYDIFERKSIDTELLEKIGQVLGYDFFQDFLQEKTRKEIILESYLTNKVYVELELSDDDLDKLGIRDKVIKKLIDE